jgi:hypothetical protein
MIPKTTRPIVSLCLVALFAGSLSWPAFAEPKTPASAQDFLKEVKQRDLEREIAAKQTEVDRQGEDLAKVRGEAEVLTRSIAGLDAAADEAGSTLERLSAERARLAQALEVATLRVEAEKLKVAGLKMLSEGQGKALRYTMSLGEVMEHRAEIAAAELKLITAQSLPHEEEVNLDPNSPMKLGGGNTTAKLKAQIAELKKQGVKSQQTLVEANTAATAAIAAASAKLALADAATAKANQRTKEIENAALAPVAAGPDEKPASTAPKATVVRPPAPASKPAATSTQSAPPAIRPPATSKKPAAPSTPSNRTAAKP